MISSLTFSATVKAEVIDSGPCGPDVIYTLDDTQTLTISGTGKMDDFTKSTIPWADHWTKIRHVIIDDGVTSIGSYSFNQMHMLESIAIPDSVTSINEFAFSECNRLESLTIPDNVTYIGNEAFNACSSLEKMIIPDSVTSIADETFRYCEEDITICCSVGSYAENYAKKHNIKYQTA